MSQHFFSSLTNSFINLNYSLKDTDTIDLLYILCLILIAVSIFAIAFTASRFVSIWKKELKHKKINLLASQIMESVYDLQDVISKVRAPFFFPSETEEILQDINKYHRFPLYEGRISYLIPFYRIKKYKDEINKFKSFRYQAQLYWNDGALDLFKQTFDIIERIEGSSKTLYEYDLPKEEKEKFIKNIWDSKETDIINPVIQKIVREFKVNLEILYKPKRRYWKKLK